MSDVVPEDRTPEPVTVESMRVDFRDLGVESGQTLLVHASLSALGWVCGGPVAVVDALRDELTEEGTLVMPTHSPGNMEPSNMQAPPIPEEWYDTVRAQLPPYRPELTPTQGMGAIPECFRSYGDVRRSSHPQHSFAAWGADANFVVAEHSLEESLGEPSPLARVYELDGDVLLLGVDHARNTSLHLAEYRADLELGTVTTGSAVLRDGQREWVQFEHLDIDDSDFTDCGEAFDAARPEAVQRGAVGAGKAKLVSQRALVDFGAEWFTENRDTSDPPGDSAEEA
jgi:aminoglycoside 3-N-acetyltransferase